MPDPYADFQSLMRQQQAAPSEQGGAVAVPSQREVERIWSVMHAMGYKTSEVLDFLIARATATNPTISDFTNANHTHLTTATGGRLSPLAWMGGPSTALLAKWDLAFWEARSETTSYAHGDAVTTITDTSAAASNFTSSGSARGTWHSSGATASQPNYYPFVRLDGSDDYYSRAARISSNAMTFVAVLRNHGGGTGYRMILTTDNHLIGKSFTANEWGLYNNNDVTTGEAMPNEWHVFVWRINGTGYDSYDLARAGRQRRYTTAGGSQGKTVCQLGANQTPTQFADVDVAAFAIASSAVSNDAVAEAVAYFRGVYIL